MEGGGAKDPPGPNRVKLNVNELKNLNCVCHDLVHQGYEWLVPFIIFVYVE